MLSDWFPPSSETQTAVTFSSTSSTILLSLMRMSSPLSLDSLKDTASVCGAYMSQDRKFVLHWRTTKRTLRRFVALLGMYPDLSLTTMAINKLLPKPLRSHNSKSDRDKGPLHLQPVHPVYSTMESLHPKRYQAHLVGTTYVYDFSDLFSKTLQNIWDIAHATSSSLVKSKIKH